MKSKKDQIHELADSVSKNELTAETFLKNEGVDIDAFVKKGLKEIKNLSKTKKPKSKTENKSKLFFKRVVLAAKIADELHGEPTFGHVKFQKLVYLSEQLCSIDTEKRYAKQAAGPYDRRFMHSIDKALKKQNWFEVKRESGKYTRYHYVPLENLEKYNRYYHSYFSNDSQRIDWLIKTFKKSKTNKVELIATLFSCWKEILIGPKEFSEDLLIKTFYDWSKEKRKFDIRDVENGIQWLKNTNLVPSPSA
ncbi:hypothetical protein [Salegentibacter maritimus]|uniref:hypothetical protein n=1 Tax=Salegentibacter maritimus TaxID=2794347 RepID=UPI0018E44347|nr:hypothetical protein [Salegentibacter maritimus]MBI6117962.1 hypothetical protein [Salegentibacter maritimus]